MEYKRYRGEYETVTWAKLKVGQEISGVTEGNRTSFFSGTVKSANALFVEIYKWGKKDQVETFTSEGALFEVEMSDADFMKKYANKAKEAAKNICNKIDSQDVGYHEMWNGWISSDPYELAKNCVEEHISIVGYFELSVNKQVGKYIVQDIGVVCEKRDGERFWCHAQSSWINKMPKRYPECFE